MKENIEKRLVALFFLMLVIVAGMACYSAYNIEASINKADWVNHVHEVILKAHTAVDQMHVGDTAVNAYILTGDSRDQQAYRDAYIPMANEQLPMLLALTRDEASHKDFLSLTNLINQHIGYVRTLVKTRESGGEDAARKYAESRPDGSSTAEIDRLINRIDDEQQKILGQRDKEAYHQAKVTEYVVFGGVIVNFALLGITSWLIRDDLKSRRVAAIALEEANAQLEAKVKERTAELVKSNQALKKENLERRWSYQALDHQFRYNQLIVNSVSEMVFVISKALNISRVNPAVTHVSKWEPQDLIPQGLDRVLQIPQDGPSHPIITALNEGRELQERTAVILLKGGGTLAVLFNLVPLRDDDKVVGGVVTVRPAGGSQPKAA